MAACIRLLCNHCGNPWTGVLDDKCPSCQKGLGVKRPAIRHKREKRVPHDVGMPVGWGRTYYPGGKVTRQGSN